MRVGKRILVIWALAAIAVGCGGGGGSDGGAPIARGTVTLPPGFELPMSRLAVATVAGQVAPNSSGIFAVPVSTAGPHLAQVIDTTTNKVVLLGFVDGAQSGSMFAGGKGQISPLTTASTLLFYGLSGTNLPPADWEIYVESIMGSTQASTLAQTIASNVASDPTAIADGNSAIVNAVEAVQATAPQGGTVAAPPLSQGPPQKASVVQVTETQTSTGELISVSNSDEPQSGIVIEPNPNGDGIVAVNKLRRRAALYAYEVATGQTVKTAVLLPQPVTEIVDQELEPEEALDSVFATIGHALLSKFPYNPVTSEPFALPADKTSPVTIYDVVVVGTGLTDTTSACAVDVAPKNIDLQPQLIAAWKATSKQLAMETLVKDVITPIALSLVLDSQSAQKATANPEFEENVENLVNSLNNVVQLIALGEIKSAAEVFIEDVVSTPSIKASFVHIVGILAQGEFNASSEFTEAMEERLESAETVMIVINKCFLSIDLTNIYADSTEHNIADDWTATVLQPKITLSPNPAFVTDLQSIALLSTTLQNVSDLSNLRFKWSTSGNEGSLEEPTSSVPMPTGITSFSQAAYVGNLTELKSGTYDTVNVTVYAENNLDTPLGTASALVKAEPNTEYGRTFIDSSDDFQGLINNDPWVISVVATCPYVSGVASYMVEAYGPNTGNYTYYVSTAGGTLQVLDGDKKPYSHYLANESGVTIAIAGMDETNEQALGIVGATDYLKKVYPVTTVLVTYQ